jgi:hypothetical protein
VAHVRARLVRDRVLEVGQAEQVVRDAYVGEQTAVAFLEDVQRERHAGEEHQRQREQRQLAHAAHTFEGVGHRRHVNSE